MSIAEKFVTMEYGPAPEDPKEAQAWLERHSHRFGHFINGAWQAPATGEYFDTVDPSNGEKLASDRPRIIRGHRRRCAGSARRVSQVACSHPARPGSLLVRPGAIGAETFPSSRRAGDDGQRQAHTREP